MVTLFYILFALCLVPEIFNFAQPQYYKAWLDELKDEAKEPKEKVGAFIFVLMLLAVQIFYMLLTIIGLFTHQWHWFLALLALSLGSSLIKTEDKPRWYSRLDATISMALIIIIIINR